MLTRVWTDRECLDYGNGLDELRSRFGGSIERLNSDTGLGATLLALRELVLRELHGYRKGREVNTTVEQLLENVAERLHHAEFDYYLSTK